MFTKNKQIILKSVYVFGYLYTFGPVFSSMMSMMYPLVVMMKPFSVSTRNSLYFLLICLNGYKKLPSAMLHDQGGNGVDPWDFSKISPLQR